MTKTAAKSATKSGRTAQARRATTLEMAAKLCPTDGQVEKIAQSFGLDPVDGANVRELTETAVAESAKALEEGLSEKAMQIHLQRIVGAYVGSAYGVGEFYSKTVSEARNLTAKLANDSRDEDLDGPVGFDSRAQRKREFAAEMALQAHALFSAAQGAVAAYARITGETWKPYERHVEAVVPAVSRQAAAAQLSAFDR
jgi:hypothetical protein